MKRIFVADYGCHLRSLDAEKICNYFSRNDYKIVNTPEEADIIFFISCAAFNKTAENALRTVKRFQKYDAELIVGGCLPAIEKEELANIFNGKTISTKDLDKIDDLFPNNKIKFRYIDDTNLSYQGSLLNQLSESSFVRSIRKIFETVKWMYKIYHKISDHILKNLLGENSYMYKTLTDKTLMIRISWGCISNCTYCGIKKAIGPLKSKPIDQCIREFEKGLNDGYKDFMICGDDPGAYGLDIGVSFPELMDNLTKIPGKYKITIRFLDPQWLVRYIDDLEKILRRNKINIIEITVQSGSSRILRLMNRFSNIDKIKNAINRLSESFPDVILSTHVIVGFPTETEEDFKQTLSFLNNSHFKSILMVPFSCIIGTEAEKLEPKVSQKDISKRVRYAKKFFRNNGYSLIRITEPKSTVFYK